jgi:hypothetical protein
VLDADGEARGRAGEGGCGVTDRQDDEERESTRRREQEDDVRRQKDRERRFDELREAWRRHHPSEPEEGGKTGPGRDVRRDEDLIPSLRSWSRTNVSRRPTRDHWQPRSKCPRPEGITPF